MQVLTPTGYVDINDLNVGDEVVAYDVNDGHLFTNILEGKVKWTYDMLPPVPPVYELDAEGNIVYDEDGNPIILVPGKTSEEVFQETYGDWKFYLINGTWVLYCNQSVWANMNVVHASELQIGDIIYDDQDQDVTITSIEEVTAPDWWRLQISGDHSYISDNLTLHNASRYWVGGGSSSNWNATVNTNWGSSSGGPNNATIPSSVDDATFDGAGSNGNTNSTISADITILSLNITTGYTSTMTHNQIVTIAGNITLSTAYTIAGTNRITISGNSTVNTNGKTWPNNVLIGGVTITLASDFNILGSLTTSGSTGTFNTSTGSKLYISGGLAVTGGILAGTVDVYLLGGTWTSSYQTANNVFIQGDVTFSGSVSYGYASGNKTLKYVSGTVTTTGSTLFISGQAQLDVNGITFNNVTFSSAYTHTLLSNLSLSGLLSNSAAVTINRTTAETVTVAGGISIGTSSAISGTAAIYVTGGTLSSGNSGSILNNSLFLNGNITMGTNFYYSTGTLTYLSGTITTTGSTLNISGPTTFNTSGMSWNNIFTGNTAATHVLLSNLTANGLINIGQSAPINSTSSETVTAAGGLTVSTPLLGTAKIILTGGTWSGGSRIANNLDINGNITISGTVQISNGTVTYVSGTVTTTGSTLSIQYSTPTLNTNGITWNNVSIQGNTITLTSNFSMSGLFTIVGSGATAINTSNSSTFTTSGGMTLNAALSGTAKIILTGGTWSGAGQLSNILDINGNVTISGSVTYGGSALTYLSGAVNTSGSTVNFSGTTTITSGAIQWWNVTHSTFSANKTLVGDMIVRGLFFNNSNGGLINKTTNEKVVIYGGLNVGSVILDGTAPFYISGGSWFGTSNVSVPLVIDGDITISGSVAKINTTLTYLSGRVTVSNAVLNLSQTIGIRGRIDKIPFTSVVISAGANISFDYFFSGIPSRICTVSSTGANYNVSFTDGFEKIARNVAITGATVAKPLQLIVINNPKFNTNRGTNSQGIRYVNQSPNGSPKGAPSAIDTMTVPALGLVGDPCFQRQ